MWAAAASTGTGTSAVLHCPPRHLMCVGQGRREQHVADAVRQEDESLFYHPAARRTAQQVDLLTVEIGDRVKVGDGVRVKAGVGVRVGVRVSGAAKQVDLVEDHPLDLAHECRAGEDLNG